MLKLADHAPAIFENGVALVDNVMGVITAMRDLFRAFADGTGNVG